MCTKHAFLTALTAVTVLAIQTSASAEDRRFAVVVGYNQSDDPDLDDLAYADDDALRTSELLGHMADRVVTLTTLDRESSTLWGQVDVTEPTRDAVIGALRSVREDMAKAKAEGHRPILYFVYSGHGNYDAEGRGYVHLRGGRLTTRDLYHHVLSPGGATDPVILMVDACNAALLVHSRGSRSERRPSGPTVLRLERHPHVGVVLASSTVGETHEWGRYLAGIFSHEVRSGLLGPADVDDDGRVTFAELAAFVASANARVTNPTVRVTPYIRPPLTEPNLALVDFSAARFPARIRVSSALSGKAHLVDQDLIRIADFHKAGSQSFWLALPRKGSFVLVRGDDEYVVPPGATGSIALETLERRKRTMLSARGAGSAYFDRTLFQQSFGSDFAKGYLQGDYVADLEVRRFVELPWYRNTAAWTTVGLGVAALAAGGGLQGAASDSRDLALATPWADERARHNADMDRYQTSAQIMAGLGGAALVGSAIWFAMDRPLAEERYQPPLRVHFGPGGILLETDL